MIKLSAQIGKNLAQINETSFRNFQKIRKVNSKETSFLYNTGRREEAQTIKQCIKNFSISVSP